MSANILLVDDNAVQAEARHAILARAGMCVVVATSGEDALAQIENEALRQTVGLLITDHLMPGMNGPELVARMLGILPGLPVLVLSGLPDAESEYAPEQVVFRLKPLPPLELIRMAQHMLGQQSLRTA